MPPRTEGLWLFIALTAFWGGNWLATKILVAEVPPFACAAARAMLCGAALLALAGPRSVGELLARARWRIVMIGLFNSALATGTINYGLVRLPSGLSAIVNNALMPIGLLVFGVLAGEETLSRRRIAGIALGTLGLALLFARRAHGAIDADAVIGLAAVAFGTLAYCLGSVWCRPLLRYSDPLAVGALQMLIGAVFLVALSAVSEHPAPALLLLPTSPLLLACLGWIAFAGGAAALVIYMRLIRDWGPARAGMYAFVTPIIASLLGVVVLGERLGAAEIAGAAILLAAAALVLAGRAAPLPPATTTPP